MQHMHCFHCFQDITACDHFARHLLIAISHPHTELAYALTDHFIRYSAPTVARTVPFFFTAASVDSTRMCLVSSNRKEFKGLGSRQCKCYICSFLGLNIYSNVINKNKRDQLSRCMAVILQSLMLEANVLEFALLNSLELAPSLIII